MTDPGILSDSGQTGRLSLQLVGDCDGAISGSPGFDGLPVVAFEAAEKSQSLGQNEAWPEQKPILAAEVFEQRDGPPQMRQCLDVMGTEFLEKGEVLDQLGERLPEFNVARVAAQESFGQLDPALAHPHRLFSLTRKREPARRIHVGDCQVVKSHDIFRMLSAIRLTGRQGVL